jgi:hypothetical protein
VVSCNEAGKETSAWAKMGKGHVDLRFNVDS